MQQRRLALLFALAGLWTACAEPPFEFTVTFPSPVEVEAGAPVLYREIAIGHVTEVKLGQPFPEEPAEVELRVAIDSPDVVLREADVIEIDSGGLTGAPHLVVLPSEAASPPLVAGARVAGRPPLATRVERTAEEALARVKELALEQAEILADTFADQIEIELDEPEVGTNESDAPADPESERAPRGPASTAPAD